MSECQQCPENTVSTEGAGLCIACPQRSLANEDRTKCGNLVRFSQSSVAITTNRLVEY